MSEYKWRSRTAVATVISHWICVAVLGASLLLLVIGQNDALPVAIASLGVILIGAVPLIWLVSFILAIVTVRHDQGRVRAGAIVLCVIPLIVIAYSIWASRATLLVDSPWGALSLIAIGVLLVIGTILIVLPERFGND